MSVIGKFVVPNVTARNFVKIGAALQNVKSNRTYFTYTQELSQPLDRKPEFVSAKEAFEKCLKSGKKLILFRLNGVIFRFVTALLRYSHVQYII